MSGDHNMHCSANELADWLDNTTNSEDWGELAKYYKWCKENVAPMLRQQQAEIETLKRQVGILKKDVAGWLDDAYGKVADEAYFERLFNERK